MKAVFFCLSAIIALALVKAGPTATPSFLDDIYRKVSEQLEVEVKKLQKLGMKIEFNQDKFFNELKALEEENKPYTKEVRKVIDNFGQQLGEILKKISSPETLQTVGKLEDTLQTSLLKIAEQADEIVKSSGIIPPSEIRKTLNEIYKAINKAKADILDKADELLIDHEKDRNKGPLSRPIRTRP